MFCSRGVVFCACVSLSSLLSRVLYLALISWGSLTSMVCCMRGYILCRVLIRAKCKWYTCWSSCCFWSVDN